MSKIPETLRYSEVHHARAMRDMPVIKHRAPC